jgi:tripartite-type tricarboxylate transporter receptor subunit TctC
MPQPLAQRVKRRVGAALVAAAAALPAAVDAQVAGYPARPVRMVVPFSAGSPIEIPARAVGQRLAETTGQQFLIDNRPGASGTIGTEIVAKAPRDGYTILVTNCSHSSNPSHYKKLPYDSIADFAPITQINVTYGNLLVVHPSVPARSVKEFIALAKAVPGKLNYASAGIGSPPHVTGAVFAAMAGIKLTHVPYKGTSVAFNDVLAGYVEVMFASPTFAHPFIQAGRVRALGIGGPRRAPLFPGVPTFQEAGLTGFDVTCYHGMWFPAGVPAEIVRRVHTEAAKAVALPEVRKYLMDNGLRPVGSSPEEFAEFLKKDIARQAGIAKQIGIKPQ